MKTAYSIILILCLSLVCKAQKNQKMIIDSLAMLSRYKAETVLKHFDTLKVPKVLYSLEDKYFYLIIKDSPRYKEYYVALDSSGGIVKILLLNADGKTRKQQKQQKHYKKLLLKAEPIFDISRYKKDFIKKIHDAKMEAGSPSYFVLLEVDGHRYGEYHLFSATLPSPIDSNLWVYLIMRLSDEIAKNNNTPH